MDGDKIKFLYLKKPNPLGGAFGLIRLYPFRTISRKSLVFFLVDYEKHFEKAFLEPLKNILETVDWKTERVSTFGGFVRMKILIVSALIDEVYGLEESVLITGVGKINATKALERELSNQLPDLVINYGTAGKTTESLSVGNCMRWVNLFSET